MTITPLIGVVSLSWPLLGRWQSSRSLIRHEELIGTSNVQATKGWSWMSMCSTSAGLEDLVVSDCFPIKVEIIKLLQPSRQSAFPTMLVLFVSFSLAWRTCRWFHWVTTQHEVKIMKQVKALALLCNGLGSDSTAKTSATRPRMDLVHRFLQLFNPVLAGLLLLMLERLDLPSPNSKQQRCGNQPPSVFQQRSAVYSGKWMLSRYCRVNLPIHQYGSTPSHCGYWCLLLHQPLPWRLHHIFQQSSQDQGSLGCQHCCGWRHGGMEGSWLVWPQSRHLSERLSRPGSVSLSPQSTVPISNSR